MMSTIAASNGSGARELEPLGARGRQPHVVAFARQQRLENVAHDLFVVDDEDRAVAGTGHVRYRRCSRLRLTDAPRRALHRRAGRERQRSA